MLDDKLPDLQQPDTETRGTPSLTASVYDRMREDVLSGRLAPDAKLRIDMLRTRYSVGSTPLREALTRLAGDGLITHEDQKGFRVAAVSRAEMRELVLTRCWLEEIALREAIARGDESWEERVVLAHHRLSRTPRSAKADQFAPNDDWEHRHRAFHLTLISACGSRWLLQYCTQLHDQADRYRRIAVVASYPQRDELAEHTRIKDAALARDTAAATQMLQAHFQRTAAIIVESIPEKLPRKTRRKAD